MNDAILYWTPDEGISLSHHGILGQKWGIRRYQNPDGSLTKAGYRHLQKEQIKADRKDAKWAKKNYNKIYNKSYKKSKSELNYYLKTDLNKRISMKNKSGSLNMSYVNEYNRKLAELMNKNVGGLLAPSGKTVKFVASRGSVGVQMALADSGYDMSQIKNGIYSSGRVAYKKKVISKV